MSIPALALSERLIVNQIKLFLDNAKADTSLFDELFNEDLTAGELTEFKNFYGNISDIPVTHAYPRADTQYPMVHVIPGSEKVSQPSVGNSISEEFNDIDGQWECTGGEYWQQDFGIGVWATEPTQLILLHHYVRVALVSSLDYFNSEGMLNILLSGTPLQPHPELSPNLVYSRGFNLSTETLIPHTKLVTDIVDSIEVTAESDEC